MNHRKATPANGTKFSASDTGPDSAAIQAPESIGSDGTERRSSQSIVIRRTEKTMPAIAAAFGVFIPARAGASTSDIIPLHVLPARQGLQDASCTPWLILPDRPPNPWLSATRASASSSG